MSCLSILVAGMLLAACDSYRKQVVIVHEEMAPGWIVIEFENDKCERANGVIHHEIALSKQGFACTASLVPAVFDAQFFRRSNGELTELKLGSEVRGLSHATVMGRRFELAMYTPDEREVPEVFENAVARYVAANP